MTLREDRHRENLASPAFTLIVINTIDPYGFEINSILAPPIGFRYQCRYHFQWVAVDDAVHQMPNTNGLVILRSFADGRLLPIRRIRIASARKVGDILFAEYVLHDWIKLSSSKLHRQRQLQEFNELVTAGLKVDRRPGQNLDQMVFLGADFSYFLDRSGKQDDPTDEHERWGNIVNELVSLAFYRGFDFLKVVRLLDDSGGPALVVPGTGYVLRNHTSYELEILHRRESNDAGGNSGHRIHLGIDPSACIPMKVSVPLPSKYGVATCRFRTGALDLPKRSFLSLSCDAPSGVNFGSSAMVRRDEEPRASLGVPEIDLPLEVARTRRQRIGLGVRVVGSIVLLALYVAPQVVLGPFTPSSAFHLDAGQSSSMADTIDRTVAQVALVAFILIASGSVDGAIRVLFERSR